MKKAFEQNVSRVKPRMRLATMFADAPALEEQALSTPQPAQTTVVENDLASEIKARMEKNRAPQVTAKENIEQALAAAPVTAPVVTARAEPPAEVVEVQNPPAPQTGYDVAERRERLKERLKAVRENPRPQPLPATVAEAGLLAVERISALQTEVNQVKAKNLSLTQELEIARRTAERATEEARLRMDEARRLSEEMAGRVKLLNDLETELSALENERDEVLLALQETRRMVEASQVEREQLSKTVAEKDKALADSLSEEERLATELEGAKDETAQLRKTVDALVAERETLARQVTDLSRERTELLDARKALEAVHRALSHAVAR